MTATWDDLLVMIQDIRAQETSDREQWVASLTEANAVVGQLKTRNQELQAQLDSLQPSTLFGSSLWLESGESYKNSSGWDRLSAYLPQQCRRTYDGGQGLAYAIDCALAAQKGDPNFPVTMSWKDSNFAGILDGSRKAAYIVQMKRLTPGIKLAPWHEYNRKILVLHEYDFPTLQKVWAIMRSWWREAGGIGSWKSIVTGYNLDNPASPLITDAEEIGIDPYGSVPGKTALEEVQPILDQIAKRTDLPVSICEIAGMYTPQNLPFIQSLGELKGKVTDIHWFNALGTFQGKTIDFRIAGDLAAEYVKVAK